MSDIHPRTHSRENPLNQTASGWLMLAVVIALFIVGALTVEFIIGIPILIVAAILCIGFLVLKPNESAVLTLFGRYIGTIRRDGFHWVNPFYSKQRLSLRMRNFTTPTLKVNDKVGNPIDVAAVVVWVIKDTAQAAFDVDDFETYIKTQCEIALRDVVSTHPYDERRDEVVSLRGNTLAVSDLLKSSLQGSVELAGIEVRDMRITHLAYAAEIASIMLRRQQAEALIQAREKMVEGAIGMVKMALDRFQEEGVVLAEQHRANLVTNMMMVLLSDEGAQPVIPTTSSAA